MYRTNKNHALTASVFFPFFPTFYNHLHSVSLIRNDTQTQFVQFAVTMKLVLLNVNQILSETWHVPLITLIQTMSWKHLKFNKTLFSL